MNYYLEERIAKYGENIIEFCKTIEQNVITRPLINQLVRSATSISANYMEANLASSRRNFQNKIFICKKRSTRNQTLVKNVIPCYLSKR